MKGIIVAGGIGSRLFPITEVFSKHLLPVYDKPMIYYPMSVLMLAHIKDILIISTQKDIPLYKKLLGDGSKFGISLSYEIQDNPRGIPEALIIGEKHIGKDNVCMILGDNIFYGHDFSSALKEGRSLSEGAMIFGYQVKDPSRFGVANIDSNGNVKKLEEKPIKPESNIAVTGLYFYDNKCVEMAKSLKPSARGELEITDLNQMYLDQDNLKCNFLGRGFSWLDTGTHESLLLASQFVQIIEDRTGAKIACLEEIALNNGWITLEEVKNNIKSFNAGNYYNYIKEFIKNEN
jgi:glucose-1-phosphate thymidylyltransferase